MKAFTRFAGLLVLFFVGLAGTAQAAVYNYNFSYVFDGFTRIDGMIDGTLQANGDTVAVNDVMATISSTGGTLGIDTFLFDTSMGGYHISGDTDSDPGFVSLSGSLMDLAVIGLPASNACTSTSGFGFCLINTFASVNIPANGSNTYSLNAGNFTISDKNAVPEPASLALIGLGLAGLVFTRRKKA